MLQNNILSISPISFLTLSFVCYRVNCTLMIMVSLCDVVHTCCSVVMLIMYVCMMGVDPITVTVRMPVEWRDPLCSI